MSKLYHLGRCVVCRKAYDERETCAELERVKELEPVRQLSSSDDPPVCCSCAKRLVTALDKEREAQS